MAILSDYDIEQAIGNGSIFIYDLGLDAIQPASVDLRLDRHFISPKTGYPFALEIGHTLWLPGKAFILGSTIERIALSSSYKGQIEGRSHVGRSGLFIHSAGHIDPGFDGQVTLELFNCGEDPVPLFYGKPICQLVIDQLLTPSRRPYGHLSRNSHYQNQELPRGSWLQ